MRSDLQSLIHADTGGYVLEYALLAIGFLVVLFQPAIFVAALYRLADLFSLFSSQVASIL